MKFCKPLSAGAMIALIIAVLAAISSGDARAQTADSRFTATVSGSGAPVLVIPGLTSSPAVFDEALAGLSDVEVHALTLAGFAGVPAPDALDAFTRPAAAAIADYIVARDLSEVSLVGHSMGGVISLLIAAELPYRVSRVLIIDSAPFLAGLMQPGADPEAVAGQAPALRGQLAAMSRPQFEMMMRQGLPRQATSPESQARVWRDIEASDPGAVALATSEIFTTDFSPVLADVAAEVTVLVPHNAFMGDSPDAVLDRYRAQYAALPQAQFRLIEDSRHFIMLDQPAAFAAALADFLDGGNHE